MAFCPECGKPATAEAIKCVHCGHELAAKEKSAAPVRFKGTMIMTPSPVTASSPVPVAPAAASTPAATPVASVPAAPSTPGPKHGLKATMLAANVPAAQPVALPAAAAAGGEERKKMAFAATAPAQAAFVLPSQPAAAGPASHKPPAPAPEAASGDQEHKKYLPGDPMAPAGRSDEPARPHHAAAHHTGPGGAPLAQTSKTWLWVALGCLGMLVIGGIGVGVAIYLGLMH
ncbi:MAG TPA: zinc ribbon domain-containing protein [Polyangiales bacterium]